MRRQRHAYVSRRRHCAVTTSGGRARSLGFMTIIVVSSSSVSMNSARPCRSEQEMVRYGEVRGDEEEEGNVRGGNG